MPVTVVVGGQFGSEGKGKVAYEFARRQGASVAVRTGGSNSGHTVIDQEGRTRVFRHLPTAAILPNVICVIGPGSYLDVSVLLAEMAAIGLPGDRVIIDPHAVVIEEHHKLIEHGSGLREEIGSTGSGTGAAVVGRILRDNSVLFAKDDPRLKHTTVEPVRSALRERLIAGERIILEGTQGFGLSVLHSEYYPFVTSRDTTAAGFLSEAGLSPVDVDEIVLVIRTFPIRVAGNSGDLPKETDWDTVTSESGSREKILEYTTVTKKERRVARFDPQIVSASIEVNAPSVIVLNHLDYLDSRCREFGYLTQKARSFVSSIERSIGARINYFGFGPASLIPLTDSLSALAHD